MKKMFLGLLAFLLIILGSRAQSISPYVIASAGDFFQGSNYSISWTLGEIATETLSSTNVVLTQGFQQPYYTIGNAVNDYIDSKFDIKAYPNPVKDFLKINVKGNEKTDLTIDLYDAIGRKLLSNKLEAGSPEVEMNMEPFRPGLYILKVSAPDGHTVKTYQISKMVK